MSTVEEIKAEQAATKASLQAVSGDIVDLVQQIADLKAQVGSGGVATQADLESILADAKSIAATVKAVDDSVPGTPAQPVDPTT